MGATIINRFMDMIGINGNQEIEEYEDMHEYDSVDMKDMDQESFQDKSSFKVRRSFTDIEQENPYSSKNTQPKVIPMNTAISSSKMVISQPTCYEEVEAIGEYLKNKKSVIINLENVGKEDARRILDFLSGATFMIEGTIQKVSNLIYLMAPKNVEIQNDIEKSQYNKQKMTFSWLK